jgi:AcrR family transcriptional regulator
MSVGNFYRYFPSKAAIVAALVTRDLAEVESGFRFIIESPDPMSALRAELKNRIIEDQCQSDGQLWAEMAAASLRKPEIAEITQQMEAEVKTYLAAVFARVLGISEEDAQQSYSAHATLLVMMIKASAMQRSANPQEREHLTSLTIRTVNRILDEIVGTDVKG